jgi:hypothetical protein
MFAIASPVYTDAGGTTPTGGFDYTFEGAKISIPTGSSLYSPDPLKGPDVADENAGVDSVGPI